MAIQYSEESLEIKETIEKASILASLMFSGFLHQTPFNWDSWAKEVIDTYKDRGVLKYLTFWEFLVCVRNAYLYHGDYVLGYTEKAEDRSIIPEDLLLEL